MPHKLCNTRTKEFFRGKFEKDLATSGKVVAADQSLRDNLKHLALLKRGSPVCIVKQKFRLGYTYIVHVSAASSWCQTLVKYRPPIYEGESLKEEFS